MEPIFLHYYKESCNSLKSFKYSLINEREQRYKNAKREFSNIETKKNLRPNLTLDKISKNKKSTKNRFYFYTVDKDNYCYDRNTFKIYLLSKELINLLRNEKYDVIRNWNKEFYKKVIRKKMITPKEFSDGKCYVTINFSNNCNLNCNYCYRNKKEKGRLSNKDLEKIMLYIKNIYYPDATEYVFSLCYTSESSLELEQLKFFEYLEYIFVKRGCNAFNWSVAEQNKHALQLYEKFINRYMGHKIGKRHSAQKSYSGIISDIFLYEITRSDVFPQLGRELLQGNLFILMDSKTASAAEYGIATSYLINKEKVILVGNKTFGAMSSGSYYSYTLPNSRIEVNLATVNHENETLEYLLKDPELVKKLSEW